MDKYSKKSIYIFFNCFFERARPKPDQSKRLVTIILLIYNSLCKENLVILFLTICNNMSECPKNIGKTGITAKNVHVLKKSFKEGLHQPMTNHTYI